MKKTSYSRRDFLAATSALGAGLAFVPETTANPRRRVAPSDQVNIAVIGVNSIGWANLNAHLKLAEVNCAALCDVDGNVLNNRAAELEKRTGKKPLLVKDYRQLLDNKEIDAVLIGTPDHWHALQMIHACQAEKDVYVEKPIATYMEECQAMVNAAKRYNRVVQVGQQQRSGPHWQSAVAYVQSGKLGKIRHVRNWIFNYSRTVPMPTPDSVVPLGVDYDLWLGPAPARPFNQYRFHGYFRYFWDYAGGLMTDWGVHLLDIALWGTGKTVPKSVMSMGGAHAFPGSMMEAPDTQHVLYDFGDLTITWEHTFRAANQGAPFGRHHGVVFYGENGMIVADRGGWELFPEVDDSNPSLKKYKLEMLPKQTPQGDDRDLHAANFVECIKTRKPTVCPIEAGAHIARVAQLGNMSQRLGRQIICDANGMPQGTDAQALAKAKYRAPYVLPV